MTRLKNEAEIYDLTNESGGQKSGGTAVLIEEIGCMRKAKFPGDARLVGIKSETTGFKTTQRRKP